MKIAISGASGLVGSALTRALGERGDEVLSLVRRASDGPGEVSWDPERGVSQPKRLEGLDAVVHLAGENIAARRWSVEQKRRIRSSRVEATRLFVDSLRNLDRPPATLISASAVGYYGDRGAEVLTESSRRGEGFLPDVCEAWEDAAGSFSGRTAQLRFGVILSPEGGAMARMLPPFKLGVGGRLGSGRQSFPWVTLQDAVGAVLHILGTPRISGPVNVVAPRVVTNSEFTKSLGHALRRPALFPLPAFAARAVFGEMADALLLSSTCVQPTRLVDSGYRFHHPEIDGALASLINGREVQVQPLAGMARAES